ncbi:unnamed protein product, partial [Hapterophycus canaliculatus]
TLPAHDIGPGSLPYQIGALYIIYCLHGTQTFRSPPVLVRVSPAAMLALMRLRWRLKAAGARAVDALAVLARLVLGDCFQGTGDASGGATWDWGPRARAEAAAKAVSKPVESLSSTYRKYAAALAEAGIAPSIATPNTTTTGDGGGSGTTNISNNANGNGSSGAERDRAGIPAADRAERLRRDITAIVGSTRRQRPLPETYGLDALASHPPLRSQMQPPAAASGMLSPPRPHTPAFDPLPLPPLPE